VSAALIGLVGVIAGALLGGLMTFQLERSKRLAEAQVARSLIAAELEGAAIRMEGAIRAGKWSSLKLPSEMWREKAGALLVVIDGGLGEKLGDAYGLIEVWNAEQANRAIEGKQEAELKRDRDLFRELSKRLKKAVPEPPGPRLRRPAKAVAVVAGVTVVVALAIGALAPRPDLSDETLAAALQAKLGGSALVACSERGGGWSCEASPPPKRWPSCTKRAAAKRQAATRRELASFAQASRCPAKQARKLVDYVVAEGAKGPVATPSPLEAERSILRERLQLEEPEKSLAQRVLDSLFKGE